MNRLQSGLFTKKDSHFSIVRSLFERKYVFADVEIVEVAVQNFFWKSMCRQHCYVGGGSIFFVKRQKYLLEKRSFSEVRTSRPIVAKWIGELFQSYIWRNKMRFWLSHISHSTTPTKFCSDRSKFEVCQRRILYPKHWLIPTTFKMMNYRVGIVSTRKFVPFHLNGDLSKWSGKRKPKPRIDSPKVPIELLRGRIRDQDFAEEHDFWKKKM